jgi:hypothetical protein
MNAFLDDQKPVTDETLRLTNPKIVTQNSSVIRRLIEEVREKEERVERKTKNRTVKTKTKMKKKRKRKDQKQMEMQKRREMMMMMMKRWKKKW